MAPTAFLNGLNFFLADVRDGLGPFLGIFLQQQGWTADRIGLVMTLGGLAGLLLTTPLGMLVDALQAKRGIVAWAALCILVACALNYFLPTFLFTSIAQMVAGIAGAAIPPAIAGLTLGLVGTRGFDHQLGRNEAFNHGGNAFAAIGAGVFGYWFGLGAVFVLMGVLTLAALYMLARIRADQIDHEAARAGSPDHAQKLSWSALFRNRSLLTVAVTVLLFHLGNAAMLPLLGQAMVARGTAGDPSAYTAATVIVAQATMIVMALLAARLAQTKGYYIVFILALLALPLRGLLASFIQAPWVLIPVQLLDGIGAGLLGVAVPGLVARILDGSGRFNTGLAAVMTVQGIGAALSTSLGGFFAARYGYAEAFKILALVASAGVPLWLCASSWMYPLCTQQIAPRGARQ